MPETVPLSPEDQKYLPYLYEIRTRLFITVIIFVAASLAGFIFYEKIIRFILNIFDLKGVNIVFTSPFQFINLAIQSAFIVGLIVIFPIAIYQIMSFVRPALSPKEFKNLVMLMPLSLFLFGTGFSYGVIIMRYTITIFYQKSVELSIGNLLDVTQFLSQTLVTAIMLGVALQFPLVMTLLIRMGIVEKSVFARKRVFFYGASLIFATFLPPTDLLSLAFLFSPLIAMYEVTILLNRATYRKK